MLYLTVKGEAFPQLDQGGASYVVGKSLDNQTPTGGKGTATAVLFRQQMVIQLPLRPRS